MPKRRIGGRVTYFPSGVGTQPTAPLQPTPVVAAGSGSGAGAGTPPQQPPVQQVIQNAQSGNIGNTIPQSIDALTQMTDSQLAQVVRASHNVDMPHHINDRDNDTQKFVFAIGLNDAPTVLQGQAFDQYLQQNGIPRGQIMSRSVNSGSINVNGTSFNLSAQQVLQQTLYGKYTYIGGKYGGAASGYGLYFDRNGGGGTGYGGTTLEAVLSPNARVINRGTLLNQIPKWQASHPQAARAIGSTSNRDTWSIYALCMGYNVIHDDGSGVSSSYYNVIDRSALVARG